MLNFFKKPDKKVTLFVSFVLQYPISPNFTFMNDLVEVESVPKTKRDIVELENMIRANVMSNMINDDRTIRVNVISYNQI